MDDMLNRLGAVETSISDIRAQVTGMASAMPYLATKADINAVKADVNAVKAEVHAMESSLLKWLIGTLIAGVALACTIAKLIG